jgi:hypothetical protein
MAFLVLFSDSLAISKLIAKKPTPLCITTYRVSYFNISQLEYYDTECTKEDIKTCYTMYRTLQRVTHREKCHMEYKTDCEERYNTEYQRKCFTLHQKKCQEKYKTVYEETCSTIHPPNCRTEGSCRQGHADSYCRMRPISRPAEVCWDEPKDICHTFQVVVPSQECKKVPKASCHQVPETEEYQEPHTGCKDEPRQRCKQTPVLGQRKIARRIPKRVCRDRKKKKCSLFKNIFGICNI